MIRDLVIPVNNEAEFVEVAIRLGIEKLYFLYDFNEFNKDKVKSKLDKILEHHDIDTEIALLATKKNFKKALKETKLVIVKSSEYDRFFLENKIKMIFSLEEKQRRDHIHQRASGLNQILCKIAKQSKVTIGFSYADLIQGGSEIMGRVVQNLELCKKYKVKTFIASFAYDPYQLRSLHDIEALFKTMGIDHIKDSLFSEL